MTTRQRLKRLQSSLVERGWEALLVSRPDDVRYLTGARGGIVHLLVRPHDAVLFAHYVDLEQSRLEVPDLPVRQIAGRHCIPEAVAYLKEHGAGNLALNIESLAYVHHQMWVDSLAGTSIQLLPDQGIVRRMRWLKDEDELARIRRATEINDIAYERVFGLLVPGVTERQIATEAERAMWEAGAESIRFLAVQFGEHSALPHYYPTGRALRKGDFVLLDWVPVFEGYASDETRTVVIGTPDAHQREVYELVARAQAAGLAAAACGATGEQVDAIARQIIAEAGYGDQFGHSLGHGINEGPSLDIGSTDVLAPGMVVTVEPGIYISGWGGVRIEDTVIITADGALPLSRTTKTLILL